MNINLSWTKFKTISADLYYADTRGNYYLVKQQVPAEYICVIAKDSEEAQEFDSDYKSQAIALVTDDT